MAPRLPLSKLEMIQDMISNKSLTASQMAKAAECSKRSIINISDNLSRFGNVRAPPTRVGRRRTATPPMIEALCDRLLEKPGLYVDEMAIFLWDEFRIQVTNSSLKRGSCFGGLVEESCSTESKGTECGHERAGNARAGNAYRIAVYQNAQCTGEAIPWSGDAAGCTNGLGNGGAGIQLLALDADGLLIFYSQPDCAQGSAVDTFNSDISQPGTECKPLNGNPVSFEFIDA